jgi:basic membrane protein A
MRRVAVALIAVAAVAVLLPAGDGASAGPRLRVGYVSGSGDVPDRKTLFGLPYAGFIRAVEKFGIEGRVVQVAPNQDPTGALSLLARQRYDLVIMGVADPYTVNVVARDFPNTKFLVTDVPVQSLDPRPPRNVQGTFFKAEESAYLAGYLAGLMEKRRPGRDVVGAVGGVPQPGVERWIVPYRLGAKKADPGIVTLTSYSNDYSNPTKCHAVALAQIARGAGAIFNVAGACGAGALEAAKEKGVWGVGVDVDQSYLGPHILTSGVDKLDLGVFRAIQRLVRGKFTTGGNNLYNLRNGGVGLGKSSSKVPRSVLRRLDDVRRQIVAGKIRVPTIKQSP